MDNVILQRRGKSWFAQEQTEERTRTRGTSLGSASRESIVADMGKGDVAVKCISPRFMKFRL